MSSSTSRSDRPTSLPPPLPTSALLVVRSQPESRRTLDNGDEDEQTGSFTSGSTPRQHLHRLRRLRDRLQSQEDRLRLDVNALKQDIVDLNTQRLVYNTKQAVRSRLLQQKTVEVVVEYFGAFQHGWIVEADGNPDSTNATDVHRKENGVDTRKEDSKTRRSPRHQATFVKQRQSLLMNRRRHFIATALDPAMALGPDRHVIEAFVLEWKTYSEQHQLARLTLTCMTCHGSAEEPIIVAVGTFSGTLTHRTLVEKYPHALSDPRLVEKLEGSTIRYPSREIFYFNSTGLVIRYDRELDYVRAFANLVESLDDVVVVLTDAKLWDQEVDEEEVEDTMETHDVSKEGGIINDE